MQKAQKAKPAAPAAYLTIQETADLLRVSKNTVVRLYSQGLFTFFRSDERGFVRISAESVERYIADRLQQGAY